MDIELKNTTVKHTIGGKEFMVDLGDPSVQDAHDEVLRYLDTIKGEGATSTEVNQKLNAYIRVAFGEEQYQELVKMGATNSANAMRIYTAMIKDFNDYNAENNVDSLLKEFGIA